MDKNIGRVASNIGKDGNSYRLEPAQAQYGSTGFFFKEVSATTHCLLKGLDHSSEGFISE